MDPVRIEKLAEMESRIAEAEVRIAQQHLVVARLRERRVETAEAEELLRNLEHTQAIRIAKRDSLVREVHGEPPFGSEPGSDVGRTD